ncbi:hypothetical protein [Oleomonas cavernae]|nr:hypothetical protein [Oleomonas cavernae]
MKAPDPGCHPIEDRAMTNASVPVRIAPETLERLRHLFPEEPIPQAIAVCVDRAALLAQFEHERQQFLDRMLVAFVQRIDQHLFPLVSLFETVLRHQADNDQRLAALLNRILEKLVSAPAPDSESLRRMFLALLQEIQQLGAYLQQLQPRR